MQDTSDALDMAIESVTRLRKTVRKATNRQVRGADERMLVKATAMAWFRTHKRSAEGLAHEALFVAVDRGFAVLLEYSDQNTTRQKYIEHLAALKSDLVKLRSRSVLASPTSAPPLPDFARLISDPVMLTILKRRWAETLACLEVNAHLAATVMMGGLLEATLLARVNRLTDLKPVFTARSAPKDNSGKARPLKDWGLKDYLDVANELGWIRQSAKDVGQVLRDYRNYIHPEKERSHGISVDARDTAMFFTVFRSLADQVIASVGT
jgi:hypothetical protein